MTEQRSFMITHVCGHAQARDLSTDPATKRAAKAKWWATQTCTACLKAQPRRRMPVSREVQAERDRRKQEALADQEASNLPPLHGSEKQLDWALRVRFELIQTAYEDLVQSEALTEDEFDAQVLVPARRVSTARWWLDVKDNSTEDLIRDLADVGEEHLGTENPF